MLKNLYIPEVVDDVEVEGEHEEEGEECRENHVEIGPGHHHGHHPSHHQIHRHQHHGYHDHQNYHHDHDHL